LQAVSPDLFDLGLDVVEGEIFPAMLGLEMCQGEATLKLSGDLYTSKYSD
jgi:hypothetical protein